MVTRAGGEGLDLKGTTHIVLLEPNWNESSVEQVVGRAIRRHSHTHLPAEKQVVHIHKLFSIKPNEAEILRKIGDDKVTLNDFMDKNERMSVDLYLHLYSKRKQACIQEFLQKMHIASLENNNCF